MSIGWLVTAFVGSFAATILLLGIVAPRALGALRGGARGRGRAPSAGPVALAAAPDAIRLVPADGPPWRDRVVAGRLVMDLEREGFRNAGAYAVPELEGLVLQLFLAETERLIGAVYEHPAAGHWIDVVERRADGSSTTWSTAPPSGLAAPPRHRKVHEPGATTAQLLARARRERGPGPACELRVAELEALFENAWAEEAAFRKAHGARGAGPSPGEPRAERAA